MSEPSYIINRPMHTVHKRRYRRRAFFVLIIILIIGAIVFFVARDLRNLTNAVNKQPVGKTTHTSIAGPQTFKNAYFQFNDIEKWEFAAGNSTATKFNYLLKSSGVPAHSLTVYINQVPLQYELATNRVLPVEISNKNSFIAGEISDDCRTQFKPNEPKQLKKVNLNGTGMMCVPDSPQYSAVVGQKGGSYSLDLQRSNGETARYIIIYRNLSVSPDPSPFIRVMKTFQAL